MTTRRVMIDHVNINVRGFAEARQFYRAALVPLGLERLIDPHGGVSYCDAAVKACGRSVSPPQVQPDFSEGHYSAYLTDPEGNRIEAGHFTRSATGGDR